MTLCPYCVTRAHRFAIERPREDAAEFERQMVRQCCSRRVDPVAPRAGLEVRK